MVKPQAELLVNRVLAVDCRWCSADGMPHSAACPYGERAQQIQQAGGIGFLQHTADDCGGVCDQHRRRTA